MYVNGIILDIRVPFLFLTLFRTQAYINVHPNADLIHCFWLLLHDFHCMCLPYLIIHSLSNRQPGCPVITNPTMTPRVLRGNGKNCGWRRCPETNSLPAPVFMCSIPHLALNTTLLCLYHGAGLRCFSLFCSDEGADSDLPWDSFLLLLLTF